MSSCTVQENGSASAATFPGQTYRNRGSRAGKRNKEENETHERISKSKRLPIRKARTDIKKQKAIAKMDPIT